MIFTVKKYIDTHLDLLNNSRLLLAVSGGIDSVVLVHLLHRLGFDITLAHVNFNLRGKESDLDEVFVQELGKSLQLPVYIYRENTKQYAKHHKLSIQMAARTIRYRWFDELMNTHKFDYLLTAHHQDDTIETFFINLLRSSGLDGLRGIPEQNGKIIRPLLHFSREDIVSYAKEQHLQWREDRSNSSTKYVRNAIRHKLLPVLQKIAPDYKKAITNSQLYLSESKLLLDDYISILKTSLITQEDDKLLIDLKALIATPHYQMILHELLKEYGFTQWMDIYELVYAQTGKIIYSKTHFLLKDRVFLKLGVLDNNYENQVNQQVTTDFTINNRNYTISTLSKSVDYRSKNSEEAYIDKSKISFPLFVRKWKKGDYFYPLGMQGKKKLSDFLIDQKISQTEKEKIYLLCDSNNTIVWVIGKRIDNRYKITETTTEILKITVQNEENI